MQSLIPALLALGVLASALLVGFGSYAMWKGADRKRAMLMVVAGLVTVLNIWLWATMPAQ